MSDTPAPDQPTVYALTQVATPAHHGTMLGLRDVADRLGVSMATVRRNVRAGRYEGAVMADSPTGPAWQVPLATVESLLAGNSAHPAQPTVRAAAAPQELLEELTRLRSELQQVQQQLVTEQAVARERAVQLEQLHATMRTLAITASSQAAPRRRWLRRSS